MYPYTTTPNYQVPQFPSFTPLASNIPEVQYVSSADSTDAFNMPPNKMAVWFNQNADEFYFVTTDASGKKSRCEFEYKPKAKDRSQEYVTRGEFDEFKTECEEIIKSTPKAPRKASQKATEVDE